MEIRKRLLAVIAFMLCFSASFAQTDNVQKDINSVKRDTAYIYAEATMKKIEDAIEGAKAVLELQVAEWLESGHVRNGDLCDQGKGEYDDIADQTWQFPSCVSLCQEERHHYVCLRKQCACNETFRR